MNYLLRMLVFTSCFALFSNLSFSQNRSSCLILDLPFDASILDQGPNNFSTTPSSTVDYVADRFGNPNGALNFDGLSDYLVLNNNNAVITGSIFTISSWVKVHGTGGGTNYQNMFFQQRANTTNNPEMIVMMHSDIANPYTIFFHNSSTMSSRQTLSTPATDDLQWHHLVMVVSSDSILGYRDGELFASSPLVQSNGTYNSVEYVTLGSHYFQSDIRGLFNGDLDDFQIYDCDLSAAQVLELYEAEEPNRISEVLEDFQHPNIYPNPTSDIINIAWPSSSKDLLNYTIYSMTGEIVLDIQRQKQLNQTIDLSALPSGMYILKINGLNTNYTSSVIKN